MKAHCITKISQEAPEWMKGLRSRSLIKIGKEYIVLPSSSEKRIYLSKKRVRMLAQNSTLWEFIIHEHGDHIPLSIKKYIAAHPEPAIVPKIKYPETQPVTPVNKKSWWQKLFF